MSTDHSRIFGLDAMRALAILGVLLSHGRYVLSQESQVFWAQFPFGTFGVELFFVLSGFLIGTILIKQGAGFDQFSTLKEFWYRRWMRTLPNYWLFLGIAVVIGLITAINIPPLWSYAVFLQNFAWPHPPFFPEAWSLAIEEWFYFGMPLMLLLLTRRLKSFDKAFPTLALGILIGSTLLRLGAYLAYNPDWDLWMRKIVVLRFDAIMFGVLAAWIKHRNPEVWKHVLPKPGLILGAIIFLAMVYVSVNRDEFFIKTFFFSVTGFGIALMLPAMDGWMIQRENFASTVVRKMALWSYSLYLCNLAVVTLINHARVQMDIPLEGAVGLLSWLVYMALCFAISAVVYRWFEKPITDLRDQPTFVLHNVFVTPKPVSQTE